MGSTLESADSGVRVQPGIDGGIEISVHGRLDARCGQLLIDVAAAAPSCRESKITVDLRGVRSFPDDGVTAATTCCLEAMDRSHGVNLVAAAGPAGDALIAILARN